MSVFNPSPQQLLSRASDFQRAGRWADAIPLYEQVLRADPRNVDVLIALGTCEVTIERMDSAHRHLAAAGEIAPRDPRVPYILAFLRKREGKYDQAIESIDEAIRLAPTNAMHVAAKAEILHMAGRFEDAHNTISKVLHHVPGVASVAATYATIALKVKRERQAIPLMEQVLARQDLTTAARVKYTFDLANLYDAVGEYSKAFPLYQRGNTLKAEPWDADEHSRLVDSIIREWSKETVDSLPRSPIDGSKFVFIVGMPRSGTSLVEQILSTSDGMYAAGERNELLRIAGQIQGTVPMGIPMVWNLAKLKAPDAVRQFASSYVTSLEGLAGPQATRISDKMPVNFLILGLVQALLPGAKVIHCRRNPMDSCLSCYFHLFGGSLGFAYDLKNCGRFYVDYERIMAHWRHVLDTPMLDVSYEDLVANQEAGTRRIFDFLGLPFTDAALRFHESQRPTLTASSQQVREAVHGRSVARWRNYDRFLGPLKSALGPYAVRE